MNLYVTIKQLIKDVLFLAIGIVLIYTLLNMGGMFGIAKNKDIIKSSELVTQAQTQTNRLANSVQNLMTDIEAVEGEECKNQLNPIIRKYFGDNRGGK